MFGKQVHVFEPSVGKLERTQAGRRCWRSHLRMSINEVIEATRKFLREDAGYEKVTISSAVAIEPDSKWKVVAEISGIGPERKEIIVDDKDGNVVSYKQA